jgi:hypothetical protein
MNTRYYVDKTGATKSLIADSREHRDLHTCIQKQLIEIPFESYMDSIIAIPIHNILIKKLIRTERYTNRESIYYSIEVYKRKQLLFRYSITGYIGLYSFQMSYWYITNRVFATAIDSLPTEIAFYPSHNWNRRKWDITTPDCDNKKEYAVNSGLWTDITYNLDGSISHAITKEEDIPQYDDKF